SGSSSGGQRYRAPTQPRFWPGPAALGARSVRVMTAETDPEIRRELIETVRRFVAREVMPVASELERADEFPDAIVEQMKSLCLFGITVPEEYGGRGLDLLTYSGGGVELAYGWLSLAGIVNAHT